MSCTSAVSTRIAAVSAQSRASALRPARAAGALWTAAPQLRAPRRQLAVNVYEDTYEETYESSYVPEWTDPQFAAETLDAFPEKAIATVEEARCLVEKGGYTYLDVRPSLELDAVGKVKKSVNIPIVLGRWQWDAEQGKKVLQKEDNPDFIAQVERRFPDKEAFLLVACSDGRAYSIDALELLDEAGYYNIVGLRGGFNSWFRTFDNNGRRRRSGEYAEQYTHDGDSCGIHSSGAGFERVDAIERWTPPTF